MKRALSIGGAVLVALPLLVLPAPPLLAQAPPPGGTPAELVATYDSLADGILALRRSEERLVRSILATAFGHAQGELARARKAVAATDAPASRAALEALAADVAQLATEGDNSVAAVRKRLLEGGHHHNAAGESQGLFDEGFVIVTKAHKQKLLETSRAIGGLASAPKADALEGEWKKVQAVYAEIASAAK